MKVRKSLEDVVINKDTSVYEYLSTDLTRYVDTLFGVGSSTVAGPTLPAGSIHPSCETLEKDCGGYYRDQPIVGFGQCYTSGAGGTKCYGNFLLAPMSGIFTLSSNERASMAVKGLETGRCYEYEVTLENGIKAKVSPTENSAIYSFEFPPDKQPSLLIDVAHKLDSDACIKKGHVTVDPENKTISGGGICTGNWNWKEWEMYFAMEFDSSFSEIGTFLGEEITPVTNNLPYTLDVDSQTRFGAYIKFPCCSEKLGIKVKIAISFVSEDKAKQFLSSQIYDFDYEKVKESAKSKWQKTLGTIELITEDKELLKRFYTAMYHMNIQPRNRVTDHGFWDDFHTIWDTWKTVFPLYSLLYPDKMSSIIESFADRATRNRSMNNGIVLGDQFMSAAETLPGQGGNDTDNVLADAYLKGIKLYRYDWEDIYAILLESAAKMRSNEYLDKGYSTENNKTASGIDYSFRFKPAASTLGFAFNDKAIANVATELGTEEEYLKFEERSKNWKNVWNMNTKSEGFCGFPQNRNSDGTFDKYFDAHGGYNSHFYEATGWDASYINYNDTSELIKTMGGRETFIKRLLWACEHSVNYFNDDHGAEGYLNFTNEPSFQIPWLFCTDEIRRPDLAAKVIDGIIERFSVKDDYPGDEDNGGMSSYYIFLMCGFFPFATTDNYYLHGTRVKEICFRLGNGRSFIVTGENVAGKNIYVQSATWQGKELNECRLTHRQILEGGELHFVMGDKPSEWARE